MRKRLIRYYLFFVMLLLVGFTSVKAGFNVSINGDLVNFSADYPRAMAFYYNTSTSFGNAVNITRAGGYFNNSAGQVSLRNGTYYFFNQNVAGSYPSATKAYTVTGSCKNETKTGQTGTFKVERCYKVVKSSSVPIADSKGTIATCADGYYLDQSKVSVASNGCYGLSLGNLSERYCKVVLQAVCSPKGGTPPSPGQPTTPPSTTPAATLTSLYLTTGNLNFTGAKKYTVDVAADVASVGISAEVANGSFVSGYGPRTVNLNFGTNTAQVKVKNSAGNVNTYTIVINRADDRSSVNSLSNLTVSEGTLSPAFSSEVSDYTVTVGSDITNVSVDGTLTDSNSRFAAGYGPGNYSLDPGSTQIFVKVVSQRGDTRVYSINVIKEDTPSACSVDTENLALLKGIDLSVDIDDIIIDPIEDFDPQVKTYEGIKVPYKVYNLNVNPYTQDDGDTVKVEGNEDLEVNITKEITITVTSSKCPTYTNMYVLNVTRQEQNEISSDASLTNIKIKNHDEFVFKPNEEEYNLKLKKGEEKLDITYDRKDPNTQCSIEGNDNLTVGNKVSIICRSEDESNTVEYKINIKGIDKGTNYFFVIIVVILIILILFYLVLRLLGYKIVFNFEVIGAFFRGIGERIRNIFDK